MSVCPTPESLAWVTSSFSDGGANCVMVGRGTADVVAVRDSKAADIPAIMFSVMAWSQFLDVVKAEAADHELVASPQNKTELYDLDLSDVAWLSAAGSSPADRVEMAHLPKGAIALRHPMAKTTLRYTCTEWIAFKHGVQVGEFAVSTAA
ncbi:DUF397 domain-containing protein [Streptosporangium sp. NBC_01755]|uniref:DUF397 domain-containing protein n=1 Tax=unclassified Streptosporangium TaxID=2632669 RepID=UPI002DDAEDEA|nr:MULTISPECIES: DUF397 domain-containing protein [unclassified Streptosporangium]WSA29789.1 DUF397 domain-containing protein [Streptosporangium sp. NBC_01810]WSD04076.1 DUF397 domain-containing protein [Streptosporangium sp. NBC_01755]